jgi:hypothetical protein
MAEGDPSDIADAVFYLDGSELWETLARVYESGADQP